jgi:hypothetical protein
LLAGRHAVNQHRKFPSFLPSLNVFESLYCHFQIVSEPSPNPPGIN